jgi:phosphatidate phosphatase APP1
MLDWKKSLKKVVLNAEERFDELKLEFKKKHNLGGELQIMAYNTYGTDQKVHFHGRVLEDRQIDKAQDNDTVWENMLNMYKRIHSNEVPNAVVEIEFQNQHVEITSNDEGYFHLTLPIKETPAQLPDIQEVTFRLKSSPLPFEGIIQSKGKVFIPSQNTDYGIISDIDDTIIETGATNILTMAQNTFLKNAVSRMPFKGVDSFYKALQKGKKGDACNPFFYVSSSPWNFFDFMEDFMDVNDLPQAPILLRDYGIDKGKFLMGTHGQHKITQISAILNTYPDLPFILVGDSGQEDARIYRQIAESFPDRILAVYIRDVQHEGKREQAQEILGQYKGKTTQMLLISDTEEAHKHAVSIGLIPD